MKRLAQYLLLGVLLFATFEARAQEVPLAAIPDSTVKPAFIALTIIDIPEVDVRAETFRLEGVLVLEWLDERYAGGPLRSFIGQAALDRLEREIWWIYPEFQNARGERERRSVELAIDPDGIVYYEERFSTLLAFRPDLRRFPFDTQELYVSIFPSLADTSFIQFQEESFVEVSPEFRPVEWEVEDATFRISTGGVYGLSPEQGYNVFSRADFFIQLQRRPGFYIWKVLIPMILITVIAWVALWMTPDRARLGERVAVLFTTMLTVVAFNFAIGDLMPRIPYLTFLDVVILCAYFTIMLVILETVVVYALAHRGREARARRVDRVCRILFPVSYALTLAVIALVYL